MRGNHIHLLVPGLGPLEGAIMLAVWEAPEPVNVREVLQELDYERPLAYTTVMTVMDILHRKGVLARDKHGRAWRYVPALSLHDYLARHLALTEQRCQVLFEAVRHEPFASTRSPARPDGEPDSVLGLRLTDDDRYRANRSSQLPEAGVAQKITVALEDDLDGGPADETVRFGFGGTEYEIDLSNKNAAVFRKHLAPYIEHARKVGRQQPRHGVRSAASRQRSGDIRTWAKAQGITVSERGRIPASVVAEFEQAH